MANARLNQGKASVSVVSYQYEARIGADMCKSGHMETFTVRGILFKRGKTRVLFIIDENRNRGSFYEVKGTGKSVELAHLSGPTLSDLDVWEPPFNKPLVVSKSPKDRAISIPVDVVNQVLSMPGWYQREKMASALCLEHFKG